MKFVIAILACMAAMLIANTGFAAKMGSERTKYGRYMKMNELYKIYGNRSWVWERGAGHFAKKRRRFTSVISVKKREYAIGNWYLPGRGKLCFKARWYSKNKRTRSVTCFTHRTKNGKIYQKKHPKGLWYVFKNKKTRKGDEFRKLKRGNLVAKRLRKLTKKH